MDQKFKRSSSAELANNLPEIKIAQPQETIAITATFTAEPLAESLFFWFKELEIAGDIEFAPYNQVFQQLLTPNSLVNSNKQGINIILVRLEDWQKERTLELSVGDRHKIEQTAQEFVQAIKAATEIAKTPYILCLCPNSPQEITGGEAQSFFQQIEGMILSQLVGVSGLYVISSEELKTTYPVETYYDKQGDKLGHIPFTPLFYTSLGTAIARKIYVIQSPPPKVIVLDCDHTLWKGVCGEDGVIGIELDPPRQVLQELMLAQYNSGMLICLCSKNNEEDVVEVFECRQDMPLKREHIISWRVNWDAKSKNLKSLASELNLGLDSFIFIDDNPVECAEVQANCPEVLTLLLPTKVEEIPRFLQHIWAFDRLKVTTEDKKRTSLY
nr:HAD-IIIC family phosphatase [Tatlockia sp.]